MDSEVPTALAAFRAQSMRAGTYLTVSVGAVLFASLLAFALAESGSVFEKVAGALVSAGLFGGMFATLPALAQVPPRPLFVEAAFPAFYALLLCGAGAVCYVDASVVETLGALPFLLVGPQTAIALATAGACSLVAACSVWIRRRVRTLSAESQTGEG